MAHVIKTQLGRCGEPTEAYQHRLRHAVQTAPSHVRQSPPQPPQIICGGRSIMKIAAARCMPQTPLFGRHLGLSPGWDRCRPDDAVNNCLRCMAGLDPAPTPADIMVKNRRLARQIADAKKLRSKTAGCPPAKGQSAPAAGLMLSPVLALREKCM